MSQAGCYVLFISFLFFSHSRQLSGSASKLAFFDAFPVTRCCCFQSSILFLLSWSRSSSLELSFSSSSSSFWMLCHFFTKEGILVLLFLSFLVFLVLSVGRPLAPGGSMGGWGG